MTVLETPRLVFRPLTPEDADDLAALYADPEVMFHFDGTRTREYAAREIEECQALYESVGYHLWATIYKEDNRFIGRCGLWAMVVEGRPEVEVAYMLARSYWGQGLGTEAARAIKEYGFTTYGFPRLISLIDPRNRASIRVAEKNGMRYVKDVFHNGYVDRLYAVEKNGT
jgi:[ribosomal protein S5]-alanine N-acetyltransferase